MAEPGRVLSRRGWRTNSRIVVLVERGAWGWPWRYFVILDGSEQHAAVLTGLALTRNRAQRQSERRAQSVATGCVWGWPDA